MVDIVGLGTKRGREGDRVNFVGAGEIVCVPVFVCMRERQGGRGGGRER